jgi:hypothetical protein
MRLAKMLANTDFFHHLSEQTIYHLVFDGIQIKKYRPGQLICRMSKRSRFNQLDFQSMFQAASTVKDQLQKESDKEKSQLTELDELAAKRQEMN